MGIGDHVLVHVVAVQVRRQGEPQPFDRLEVIRDDELGPQRNHVAGVRAGDHVLEQRDIGHRARQRTFVAIVVEVEDLGLRHAAVRRLESDYAAEGGGDPDRPTDVRAGGESGRSGGERRARPPTGTARRKGEVPWVARDTPELRPRDGRAGELRRRRPRVDDGAGVEDPLHEHRGVIGDHVAQSERAKRVLVPGDRRLFLDRDRDAFQGTRWVPIAGISGLGCLRLRKRLVEEGLGEGVDRGLDCRRAVDDRLDQLDRRELATLELLYGLSRRYVVQIAHLSSPFIRLPVLFAALASTPALARWSGGASCSRAAGGRARQPSHHARRRGRAT